MARSTRASLYDNNFLFFGDWNVFLKYIGLMHAWVMECLFVRETGVDALDKQLTVEENHGCSCYHTRSTRQSSRLSIPRCHRAVGQRSFSYRRVKLWSGIGDNRDLKQRRRRLQWKHHYKNEFGPFQTLSRLFGTARFVKCRRLFLELNLLKRALKGLYPMFK